jgi:Lrp/AsnC family transcriptional regulator for asnA, asnC and gidA
VISLDGLDCRIIELLQDDARMSSREMTCRLGDVSDRVVRYRIKRLLDQRVVFLQAMVNPRQVGYPVVADILIDVVPLKLAETCVKLAGMETVASVSTAYAGRQLSIQVNSRNERELMTFVKSRLPQLDGIVSAQAMVVPHLIKDLAFWRPPAADAVEHRRGPEHAGAAAPGRQRRAPGSDGRQSGAVAPRQRRAPCLDKRRDDRDQDAARERTTLLDALDRQIVKLLQEDPRMSSREMTCRLGDVSDRVVRYRIGRLLDWRVVLVQARVNPHEVGYPVVADILIDVAPWKLDHVCAELAAMELVCYVSAAPAGHELSIEVNARSEGELVSFVKTRLPRIDGIASARAMVVPLLAKDVAAWEIPRQL